MEYLGSSFVKKEVNAILGTLGMPPSDRFGEIVHLFLVLCFLCAVAFGLIIAGKSAFSISTNNKEFEKATTSPMQILVNAGDCPGIVNAHIDTLQPGSYPIIIENGTSSVNGQIIATGGSNCGNTYNDGGAVDR